MIDMSMMLDAIKRKVKSLEELVDEGTVGVSLLNDFNWLIQQAEERAKWKGTAKKRNNVIKNLKWKLQGARNHVNRVQNYNDAANATIEHLREENEKLRKALAFYENEEHYTYDSDGYVNIVLDNGEIARKALEGLK